ncbi:hypothetical protein HK102_012085 [Quaeritorhiza haematococci]|nr:hypothetical protein HK102_012085 [Quaeritorhiza haematococci]
MNVIGLILAISFDATCSLVVLDGNFKPVSITAPIPASAPSSSSPSPSKSASPTRDVIMWMDHRALPQSRRISSLAQHNDLTSLTGGVVSPEMSVAKVLWLYENMQDSTEHGGVSKESWWERARHFMELPDFLTWRASRVKTRGLNSLGCKWLYSPSTAEDTDFVGGWKKSFWKDVGLEGMVEEGFVRFGGEETNVVGRTATMKTTLCGEPVGYLTPSAAGELLGLDEKGDIKVVVASGIIDAYAGAIGTLGAKMDGNIAFEDLGTRLAMIAGTSACHIAVSGKPVFVPGVWGPYGDVLLPQTFCLEGGQTATGKLLDHVITTHPAHSAALSAANSQNTDIYTFLHSTIQDMAREQNLSSPHFLTRELHMTPDFHGNRSPLADPSMRGGVVGLTLDNADGSVRALALLYLAAIQSLAYSTRHIISAINAQRRKKGGKEGTSSAEPPVGTILLSGGLCKNYLFVKTLADAVRVPVVLPRNVDEIVLVGSAISAAAADAVASSRSLDSSSPQAPAVGNTKSKENDGHVLWDFMTRMTRCEKEYEPTATKEEVEFHERKFGVFLKMYENQIEYRKIMEGV